MADVETNPNRNEVAAFASENPVLKIGEDAIAQPGRASQPSSKGTSFGEVQGSNEPDVSCVTLSDRESSTSLPRSYPRDAVSSIASKQQSFSALSFSSSSSNNGWPSTSQENQDQPSSSIEHRSPISSHAVSLQAPMHGNVIAPSRLTSSTLGHGSGRTSVESGHQSSMQAIHVPPSKDPNISSERQDSQQSKPPVASTTRNTANEAGQFVENSAVVVNDPEVFEQLAQYNSDDEACDRSPALTFNPDTESSLDPDVLPPIHATESTPFTPSKVEATLSPFSNASNLGVNTSSPQPVSLLGFMSAPQPLINAVLNNNVGPQSSSSNTDPQPNTGTPPPNTPPVVLQQPIPNNKFLPPGPQRQFTPQPAVNNTMGHTAAPMAARPNTPPSEVLVEESNNMPLDTIVQHEATSSLPVHSYVQVAPSKEKKSFNDESSLCLSETSNPSPSNTIDPPAVEQPMKLKSALLNLMASFSGDNRDVSNASLTCPRAKDNTDHTPVLIDIAQPTYEVYHHMEEASNSSAEAVHLEPFISVDQHPHRAVNSTPDSAAQRIETPQQTVLAEPVKIAQCDIVPTPAPNNTSTLTQLTAASNEQSDIALLHRESAPAVVLEDNSDQLQAPIPFCLEVQLGSPNDKGVSDPSDPEEMLDITLRLERMKIDSQASGISTDQIVLKNDKTIDGSLTNPAPVGASSESNASTIKSEPKAEALDESEIVQIVDDHQANPVHPTAERNIDTHHRKVNSSSETSTNSTSGEIASTNGSSKKIKLVRAKDSATEDTRSHHEDPIADPHTSAHTEVNNTNCIKSEDYADLVQFWDKFKFALLPNESNDDVQPVQESTSNNTNQTYVQGKKRSIGKMAQEDETTCAVQPPTKKFRSNKIEKKNGKKDEKKEKKKEDKKTEYKAKGEKKKTEDKKAGSEKKSVSSPIHPSQENNKHEAAWNYDTSTQEINQVDVKWLSDVSAELRLYRNQDYEFIPEGKGLYFRLQCGSLVVLIRRRGLVRFIKISDNVVEAGKIPRENHHDILLALFGTEPPNAVLKFIEENE